MGTVRAPAGLGKAGRALWREVNREFGLAPHESAILIQVCRVIDRLDAIELELSGASLTVEGQHRPAAGSSPPCRVAPSGACPGVAEPGAVDPVAG